MLVFGESLGAWTSSDVVMYQGIDGFDHYGIDRALWVGLPWLAKWSRSGMTRGSTTLVPEGTVGVFDRHEQLQELTDEQRARLRAVILSHDNDPIAVMGPDLIVQRPPWLADEQRGRGVPEQMRWRPQVTFVQTAMDAGPARPGRPATARPPPCRGGRSCRRPAPHPTYPRRPVAPRPATGAVAIHQRVRTVRPGSDAFSCFQPSGVAAS